MLDKVLFWVVLIWMVGMLVMAFIAVREVWRDSNRLDEDPDAAAASPKESPSSGDGNSAR